MLVYMLPSAIKLTSEVTATYLVIYNALKYNIDKNIKLQYGEDDESLTVKYPIFFNKLLPDMWE